MNLKPKRPVLSLVPYEAYGPSINCPQCNAELQVMMDGKLLDFRNNASDLGDDLAPCPKCTASLYVDWVQTVSIRVTDESRLPLRTVEILRMRQG